MSWTAVAQGQQKRSIKLVNPVCRAPQNVLKCHRIVTKYLWVAETCLRGKVGTEPRGRVDIVSGEGRKCVSENKGERWGGRNQECAEQGRQVAQPFLEARTQSHQDGDLQPR